MKFIYLLFFVIIIVGCTTGNVVKETEFACSKGSDCHASEVGDYIMIPVSDIKPQMSKHTYEVDGVDVNYITVLGSDGNIRTAFDACDVCGGYKGYHQEGNDVVCNNCGRHFAIDSIGTENGPGGCWPSYLENGIENGFVKIHKDDLAAGSYRFA